VQHCPHVRLASDRVAEALDRLGIDELAEDGAMSGVGNGGRDPDELRERAVRMVFEHQGEYSSQWKAILSIAESSTCTARRFGVGFAERRSMRVDGRGSRPTSEHLDSVVKPGDVLVLRPSAMRGGDAC
jgi:hypothetical protein